MEKKALVLAICMACTTPAVSIANPISKNASGLNLGEVKSRSHLGEPFNGFIPILFTSKDQASKLKVRLAPTPIYERLGAEKAPELSSLNFKVVSKSKQSIILITSKSVINSPILNFILEIESPEGKIYQDFTTMLDPKGYGESKDKFQIKIKSNANLSSPLKLQTTEYKIMPGDSLSTISQKFKNSSISLNRMMEAIHLKNPKAFIHNDINKIKSGSILSLPTFQEVKNIKLPLTKPAFKKQETGTYSEKMITYKVKTGDTLSQITRKFLHKGSSFTKAMNAIHTANPNAFSKNKINALKAGATLTIPSFANVSTEVADVAAEINELMLARSKNSKITAPDKTHTQQANTETLQSIEKDINLDNKLLQQANIKKSKGVGKLEKRVRELRDQLSSTRKISFELKTKIAALNNTITKQEQNIAKLNNRLINAKRQNKNYARKLKTEKMISSELMASSIPNNTSDKSNHQSTNSQENLAASSQNIEPILSSIFGNKALKDDDLLTLENLSYSSIILLILGFLLLRRRKELDDYLPIEKTLNNYFKDTNPLNMVKGDISSDDTSIAQIKADKKQNNLEFSEETIQECEHLVDELIESLNTHKGKNTDPLILSSTCDQDLESNINDEDEVDIKRFARSDIQTPQSTKNDQLIVNSICDKDLESCIEYNKSDTINFTRSDI